MKYIIEDHEGYYLQEINYKDHKMLFNSNVDKAKLFNDYISAWKYIADNYIPFCSVSIRKED